MGGSAIGQVEWALVLDSATFLVAACLIATLPLVPRRREEKKAGPIDLAQGVRELREGWAFIAISPQVRAVLVGLATGMIGGGMLIPLGAANDVVLGAGNAGLAPFW